jgi:hypothetical protein
MRLIWPTQGARGIALIESRFSVWSQTRSGVLHRGQPTLEAVRSNAITSGIGNA